MSLQKHRMTSNQIASVKKQTQDAYDWLARSYSQNWSEHIDRELTKYFLTLIPENATKIGRAHV